MHQFSHRGTDDRHRLIGALLAEKNEDWQARRYLDMDDFYEWLAERKPATQDVVTTI